MYLNLRKEEDFDFFYHTNGFSVIQILIYGQNNFKRIEVMQFKHYPNYVTTIMNKLCEDILKQNIM